MTNLGVGLGVMAGVSNNIGGVVNESIASAVSPGAKRCTQCGSVLSPNAKFCAECGAKVEIICPNCGKNVPHGAKFCAECGQRIGGEANA